LAVFQGISDIKAIVPSHVYKLFSMCGNWTCSLLVFMDLTALKTAFQQQRIKQAKNVFHEWKTLIRQQQNISYSFVSQGLAVTFRFRWV